MAEPRIRIAGPVAEHKVGHRAYRVEVLATLTYEMIAPSVEDAERYARRMARGVVHNDEISLIDVKPINPLQQLRDANLRGWLEGEAVALMTDDQRERLGAGENMEAEILHVVRAELYKGFSMPRWEPIRWQEVKHPTTCPLLVNLTADRVKAVVDIASDNFGPWPTWPITKDHRLVGWEAESSDAILEQCHAICNHPWLVRSCVKPTADLIQHTAKCRACGSSVVRRSVSVRIPWAGRILSREFAL